MSNAPTGLVPSVGWAVIHLFYRIDRMSWHGFAEGEHNRAIEEMRELLTTAAAEEGMQISIFAGITKCDFGVMAVHPDVWRVQRLIQEIAATRLGSCLETVYSFLSLSEASEYITNETDWTKMLIEQEKLDPTDPAFTERIAALRKRTNMYSEARLHPQLPGAEYPLLCFYPMAKSRGEENNWYRLSFDERKKFMIAHGNAARGYASRVTQLITTATGIDDWEWGVTLFSRDLRAFRDIVYELRYDPASALYGLFGQFYIGARFAPENLGEVLKLN